MGISYGYVVWWSWVAGENRIAKGLLSVPVRGMVLVIVMQDVKALTFRGEWNEVVNKGEAVSEALQDVEAEDEHVEAWEEWRPREEEAFDKELREKTAKTACVEKNAVEQDGKSAVEEAGAAVGDLGRAVEAATNGERDTASEKSRHAAVSFALSVDTVVRKAVRRFELIVYKHVVTRTNPYYFDNSMIFAAMQEKHTLLSKTGKKEKEYSLSVEIQDDDVSNKVAEHIQERE